MRLEQLSYVTAVTEYGSLRRAGEHLHVSQPALSEAITKLERELGTPLLDRHRSGARISGPGLELLPHISEVLEAVERLRIAANGQTPTDRPIRIGSVNTGESTVVLPALRGYQQGHPDAQFELRQLRQDEIQVRLREGTLDLGLVNLLPGDELPSDLLAITLVQGHPAAVLPAAHPLAQESTVSVDQLRKEVFVGAREGFLMHRVALKIFGDDRPQLRHSCDGADIGMHMVASGLGVSVLPDFSVTGDPRLEAGLIALRPLVDETPIIAMVALVRRSSRPPKTLRRLTDQLLRQAREVMSQQD